MLKNVVFNLGSYLSSLLISFFLSPFILRQLGASRYGVWALLGEMLSYYGLLDFGVRGALSYYIGRSLAVRDSQDLKRYASTAFFGLAAVSTFCFGVSLGVLWWLKGRIDLQSLDRTEVFLAAGIFLFIFCLGLPLEIFAAILVGKQKLYVVNWAEMSVRLVSAVLMFALLSWRPSLLAVCLSQAVGRLLYWVTTALAARRYVPEAGISLRAWSWEPLRQLMGYGGQNAVINLSWLLITRKDATVITVFLGSHCVPAYHFARLIVENLTQGCLAITQALRPTLVYHWATGERERVYAIYYAGARYSAYVVTMLAAFLFAYGSDFLRLWIGSRYVTGSPLYRSDFVLFALLAAHLPRLMHSISWQLLFATNQQRALTILIACEGVVNTVLAILLVRPYGVLGVAFGTLIPMLLSHLVILPLLMRKLAGISLRRYVWHGVGRPVLAALAIWIAGVGLRSALPPAGWRMFFAEGIGLGALALLLGAGFVVKRGEWEWVRATLVDLRAGRRRLWS